MLQCTIILLFGTVWRGYRVNAAMRRQRPGEIIEPRLPNACGELLQPTDFMTQPILHFVHANSFPADTYRVFFGVLGRHYDVRALPIHAHNLNYPVDDGWQALAHELIDELRLRYAEPVILAGHSMGGILALMAAKARPDLVRCVVLLDAPLIAGWRAFFL
jgi:pimeloyl-ACP methyl ester carboxylesterase